MNKNFATMIFIYVVLAALVLVQSVNKGQVSIFQKNTKSFDSFQTEIKSFFGQENMTSVLLEEFEYHNAVDGTSFVFGNFTVLSTKHDLQFTYQMNSTSCEFQLNPSNDVSNEILIAFNYDFENPMLEEEVNGVVTIKATSNYTITKKIVEVDGSYSTSVSLNADYILKEYTLDHPTKEDYFKSAIKTIEYKITQEISKYLNQNLEAKFENFFIYPFSVKNSHADHESLSLDMNLSNAPICTDDYNINFYRGNLLKNWNKTYSNENFQDFSVSLSDYQIFVSYESINESIEDINKKGLSFTLNNENIIKPSPFYLNIQSLGQVFPELYTNFARSDSFYINSTFSNIAFKTLKNYKNASDVFAVYQIDSKVLMTGTDEELFSFRGLYQSEVAVDELDLQFTIVEATLVKLDITDLQYKIFYSNVIKKWISDYLAEYFLQLPLEVFSHPYNLNSLCDKMDHYTAGNEGIILACSPKTPVEDEQIDEVERKFLDLI